MLMITVGLIEDDNSFRRNLEMFVQMENDLYTSFSCNSMEAFLEQRHALDEPFIVFIDLGLPGISGLEGITYLREKWAETHIVVITGNDDEDVIFDCIQRGANGYLLKPFKLDDLKKNINIIRHGGALITPDVAMKLFRKIHKPQERFETTVATLTARENDVVNELLKGLTYKEIAAALGISATTVNDHLKNVYTKMGVRTKSELIAKVLKR
jgi:DNA-binding NarL/FixJ family response regulator